MGKFQRGVKQLLEHGSTCPLLLGGFTEHDAQACAGKQEKAPALEELLVRLGKDLTPREHHGGRRSLGHNLDAVLLGRLQGGSRGQREGEPRRAF